MNIVVADASALLPALLPSEKAQLYADMLIDFHATGQVQLVSPTLLLYEVLNALYLAVRGKSGSPPRLPAEGALERWKLFLELGIVIKPVEHLGERILELALTYQQSCYDMVYIALAEALNATMLTADERLLNAVGSELKWVEPLWEFTL
ncbi:type II toxin-antitoxin system VapC family toxin [Candidatus Bipolaricaulota bacterium]|nr:type II toxin-antitoxin system VapC family toxin [Candidatus Bipolaricaulota bacterium]